MPQKSVNNLKINPRNSFHIANDYVIPGISSHLTEMVKKRRNIQMPIKSYSSYPASLTSAPPSSISSKCLVCFSRFFFFFPILKIITKQMRLILVKTLNPNIICSAVKMCRVLVKCTFLSIYFCIFVQTPPAKFMICILKLKRLYFML